MSSLSTGHGDFDGDLYPDVFHFDDGYLQVMLGVSYLQVRMVSVAEGNLAATIPGTAGQDDLVVLGPDGLVRWTWDEALVGFQPTILDGNWGPSVDLATYRTGSDIHVVALLAGGTQVRRARISNGTLVTVNQFPLGYAATDVELLQWEAGGLPELADLSSSGSTATLSVRRLANPTHMAYTQTFPGVTNFLMRRIKHSNSSVDWLAAIGGTSTNQALAVVAAGGVLSSQALAAPAVALECADYDSDGYGDLLLTLQGTNEVGVLINLAANEVPEQPTFAVNGGSGHTGPIPDAEYVETGISTANGTAQTRVIVTDVDNDGDQDLALHAFAESILWVGMDERVVDQNDFTPLLERVGTTNVGVTVNTADLLDPDDDGLFEGDAIFHMGLELPTSLGTANHVQVICWTLDVLDETGLETQAFFEDTIPVSEFGGGRKDISFSLDGATFSGNSTPSVGVDPLILCTWRLVQVDQSSEIVDKLPSTLIAFQAYEPGSENPLADFMANEMQALSGTEFTVIHNNQATSVNQAVQTGGGDNSAGNGTGSGDLPCADNRPPFPR